MYSPISYSMNFIETHNDESNTSISSMADKFRSVQQQQKILLVECVEVGGVR